MEKNYRALGRLKICQQRLQNSFQQDNSACKLFKLEQTSVSFAFFRLLSNILHKRNWRLKRMKDCAVVL